MENTSFKVFIEEQTQDYGKLYIEPLERGYGDTLGNALRRLLLSSIRGAAVTAVRIDGVLHEFSTIPGVREDVIEILMNLKHIPIKAKNEKTSVNADGFKIITIDSDSLPRDFFTRSENPGVITAKDLTWDNDFEFCGDGVLCTLEPNAHLLMEIYVEQGVGYLSAERERPSQPALPIDALLTDAIFSPVKRVNYQIAPARVGQSIDFERLTLEIWTNGAISPEEALCQAARIAENYFGSVANTLGSMLPAPVEEKEPVASDDTHTVEPEKDKAHMVSLEEWEKRSVHDLDISLRSENCLRRGDITLVGELLSKSRDDLLKIRNFGDKSLTEIEERLVELGLALKPNPPKPVEGNDDDIFSSTQPPEELVKNIQAAVDDIFVTAEDVPEVEESVPEKPKAKPKPKPKTTSKPKTKKVEAEVKVEAPAEEVKTEAVEPKPEEVKTEEEPKPKPKAKAKPKTKKAEAKVEVEAPAEEVKPEAVESKPEEEVKEEVKEVEAEETKPKAKAKAKAKSKPKTKKVKTEEVKEAKEADEAKTTVSESNEQEVQS